MFYLIALSKRREERATDWYIRTDEEKEVEKRVEGIIYVAHLTDPEYWARGIKVEWKWDEYICAGHGLVWILTNQPPKHPHTEIYHSSLDFIRFLSIFYIYKKRQEYYFVFLSLILMLPEKMTSI